MRDRIASLLLEKCNFILESKASTSFLGALNSTNNVRSGASYFLILFVSVGSVNLWFSFPSNSRLADVYANRNKLVTKSSLSVFKNI